MNLDRRTLLIGGGVGVGLIVGYALWPRGLHSDLAAQKGEQAFGNFIKISNQGRVTVAVPQVETGQGIWTALPQVVADELGAAWETVAVEPAPLTNAYVNPLAKAEKWPRDIRITASATSVRGFEQPMREAAAMARALLVGAAADRWGVSEADCETADGFVLNKGRTFTFGELAEEAADRSPPRQPQLRKTAQGRLVGQSLQRLDGPAKSGGSFRYAPDVRLPGMLFAAVRRAPPGGRLRNFSREAISRMPGVRHVATRDDWIAAVADSWWTAEQALKAADPVFSGSRTPPDLRSIFEHALANFDPEQWFTRGNYDATVRGSRPLAATYYVAPSQHLGLEPLSATARASSTGLEVWTATQAPGFGHDAHDAILYPMPVGEPAGRALEPDAVPIAEELARELKRPVQVIFSQNQGQNHDRPAPGAMAHMTALPGEGGITAAWAMRIATGDGLSDALARLGGERAPRKFGARSLDGAAPPYAIPHVRIDAIRAPLPFAPGYMRASPERELCFFTESFIDELARAAGMEPLSFRMSMLGEDPRLARCFEGATRLAGWDGGAAGSNMGLAGCSAFGSHIALVATASIGSDQRIKVHRLVAAVDCGRTIHQGLVTQQIEAGLIWGLAQATVPSPEWISGMPRARSLGELGLPRMRDLPEIIVELIPSSDPAGGIGGLGTTVLAPALANAIFAGTGKRMRSLPFDPMTTT